VLLGGAAHFTAEVQAERDRVKWERDRAVTQERLTGVERDNALEQKRLAGVERDRARDERQAGRHSLYAAHIPLAHRAWRDAQIGQMRDLLDGEGCRSMRPDDPDLRGWEWYYLNGLCHKDDFTLKGEDSFCSVSFSPGARLVASGSWDRSVRVWNLDT